MDSPDLHEQGFDDRKLRSSHGKADVREPLALPSEKKHRRNAGKIFSALAFCAMAAGAAGLRAQENVVAAPPFVNNPVDEKKAQLRGVESDIGLSVEQKQRIEQEIAMIRDDRAKLTEALQEAARRVNAVDQRLAEAEKRLDLAGASEQALRRSLEARRGLIAEILSVLQRMGRKPPPALLVNPDDVLQAIRASMALGAVLPELRAETEALIVDLKELARLRAAILEERESLARDQNRLSEENARLGALIEAKRQSLSAAEGALGEARRRAEELGRQSANLRDLIARMEADSAGALKAMAEAQQNEEKRRRLAALEAQEQQTKIAAAPFRDAGRMAPAAPFASLRGRAAMPVAGEIARRFGEADPFGSADKNIAIAARPNAVVVSPADAFVVFAAPYRGYKQLLILNPGDGYYIVLAGMEKIHVANGQFVLAGEPVAAMGEGAAKVAAAAAIGSGQPILYVEFRKDGTSIDPTPWWTRNDAKKVR